MNRHEHGWGVSLLPALSTILLVTCLGSNSAFAQDPAGRETLEKLLSACKSRAEQRNPIWVRYTLTQVNSVAFQKATGQPESDAEIPHKVEAEYAIKGAKTRSWRKMLDPPLPDNAWRKEDYRVFTGEILAWPSSKPGTFMVSKRPKNEVVVPTPWGIIGEDKTLDMLKGWKEGKKRFASVSVTEQRDPNGGRVSVVAITYSTKWRSKGWYLPDKGWVLQRSEVYDESNSPVDISEVDVFENYAGLDLPKQGYSKHYIAGGKLGQTLSFEVTAIERSAAKIPDRLFRVSFPPDADLWDVDNGETIRNAGLAQSHLDEVVRRMEPPSPWRAWLAIILLVACVSGGALVGYTAYRRRRAKAIG
jgi:hypothetical protein